MRRAAKRDVNERAIIEALRSIGATVYQMDEPCDLLVGFRNQTILIEIKNPKNYYGKKGLNVNQQNFLDKWRGGLFLTITSIDEVLQIMKGL